MSDLQAMLLFRALVVVGGLTCVTLGFLFFEKTLNAHTDLRFKLGNEFVAPKLAIIPGIILISVGVLAIGVAYFCPPS